MCGRANLNSDHCHHDLCYRRDPDHEDHRPRLGISHEPLIRGIEWYCARAVAVVVVVVVVDGYG